MPDCESVAAHSLISSTIIFKVVAGDIGVCHADCHEGGAKKRWAIRAAEVVGTPL